MQSTAIAKSNVTEMHAPVRAIESNKPFFHLAQLQSMAREDLEVLCLGLQCKTLERRTKDGVLTQVRRVVPLVYGKAEDIYDVKVIGTMLNAKAYRKCAAFAGVKFFNPPSIEIDGETRSNPHIERDPVTKANKRCFVRKVAVWRGPLGEPVARDLTLVYDPGALFNVALRGKISANPGKIISTSRRMSEACEPGWAFFPEMALDGTEINGVPGTALYVGLLADLSNPDVSDLIKDRSDKSKFIERYADTFCERNLTKKMLNLPVPIVVRDAKGNPLGASILIEAWIAPSDEAFVTRTVEAMQGLTSVDDPVRALQDQGIIVTAAEIVHADSDEEGAVDVTVGDGEETDGRTYDLDPRRALQAERREEKTPAPTPQPDPDPAAIGQGALPLAGPTQDRAAQIAGLMKRLDAARKAIGDGPYKAACASVEVDPERPGAKGVRVLESLVFECEEMAKG